MEILDLIFVIILALGLIGVVTKVIYKVYEIGHATWRAHTLHDGVCTYVRLERPAFPLYEHVDVGVVDVQSETYYEDLAVLENKAEVMAATMNSVKDNV